MLFAPPKQRLAAAELADEERGKEASTAARAGKQTRSHGHIVFLDWDRPTDATPATDGRLILLLFERASERSLPKGGRVAVAEVDHGTPAVVAGRNRSLNRSVGRVRS